MSVILTYDSLLARVQVSGSAVTGTAADVDRSCDGGASWARVRGGSGAVVASGNFQLPVDDYEFCTGSGYPSGGLCPPGVSEVVSHYRICGYTAESMLVVTGGPNSYASTPDAAALDVTGDIDIRMGIRPDDWTPANDSVLAAKYTISGDQRSWALRLLTSGKLIFNWSPTGTFAALISVSSTSSVPIPPEHSGHVFVRVTVDVDNGNSGHTIIFYYATDFDGPWTQLGSPVTRSGTTSIFASTATLEIGAGDNGGVIFTGGARFSGDVTRFELRNGINGTAVANPDFTARSPGDTSFVDAAGRTWTVQSTAKIATDPDPPEEPTYTGCQTGSITPAFTGPWLKSIARPYLNRSVTALRAFANVERSARGGVFNIVGRSVPVAVTDVRGSRRWTLQVCTQDAAEAHELDLMLVSGDPLFLQVPPNSNLPVPSMHVFVGDTSVRKEAWSNKRTWTLPLVEVAAPGADVVGGTIDWRCVIDTYATWQAVLNDNTSWAALLQQTCDESSVFVG